MLPLYYHGFVDFLCHTTNLFSPPTIPPRLEQHYPPLPITNPLYFVLLIFQTCKTSLISLKTFTQGLPTTSPQSEEWVSSFETLYSMYIRVNLGTLHYTYITPKKYCCTKICYPNLSNGHKHILPNLIFYMF